MNELLFFGEIIIYFSTLLLAHKLFKKNGIYCWIAIAAILANILSSKSINLFGISSMQGTVMFASIFLATDMLNENYGKKEARKGVYIGAFSIIVFLIVSQISILFIPNGQDNVTDAIKTVFQISPRVCLASLFMFILSNILDVYLFEKLKNKLNNKKLWLRNNVCTIICNCVENFGFVFLAFIGIYPMKVILEIALSTSIIEIIVAICDTPFIYLSKKIDKKELKDEQPARS